MIVKAVRILDTSDFHVNTLSKLAPAYNGRHITLNPKLESDSGFQDESIGKLKNCTTVNGVLVCDLHIDEKNLSVTQHDALKEGQFTVHAGIYGEEEGAVPSHIYLQIKKGSEIMSQTLNHSLKNAFNKVLSNNKVAKPMERQDLTEIFKANHEAGKKQETAPTENQAPSEGLQRRDLASELKKDSQKRVRA